MSFGKRSRDHHRPYAMDTNYAPRPRRTNRSGWATQWHQHCHQTRPKSRNPTFASEADNIAFSAIVPNPLPITKTLAAIGLRHLSTSQVDIANTCSWSPIRLYVGSHNIPSSTYPNLAKNRLSRLSVRRHINRHPSNWNHSKLITATTKRLILTVVP
jgi:hypothetical protein